MSLRTFVHHSKTATVLSVALFLVGCAATTSTVVDTTSEVASSVGPDRPRDDLDWSRCGDLDCARVTAPIDHDDPTRGDMEIAVFRRGGASTDGSRTIVFVPDRVHGPGAKELLESVPVRFGRDWLDHTLIALEPRVVATWPPQVGEPPLVSMADIAGDLALLRTRIAAPAVDVVGWGDGASAVAAAVMGDADLFESVVLDSPTAVHLEPLARLEAQIESDADVVDEALAWCASHISCTMNANVARSFNAFKTNLRLGLLAPEVSNDVVGAAARWSFAAGDIGNFFRAVTEATDGDPERLLALSRTVPESGRVAMLCAEVTIAEAEQHRQRLMLRNTESTAHFRMGDEWLLYARCGEGPSGRSFTVPVIDDGDTPVLVVVSQNNPVTGAALSRALAAERGWQSLEVPVFGHLVVGNDADTTDKVLDFLVGRLQPD